MKSAAVPELQIVILAAGFSSRLGRAKALAPVRSVSLLRRTLLLAARFAPARTIAVLPPGAARYRTEGRGLKVTFVVNSLRSEGLSSSVRRGIAKARYSAAVLLLPVDMAGLQPRDIARLIARWRGARRRVIARCLSHGGNVPVGAGHGGVPLILPRWLFARALGIRGDTGLRGLIAVLPRQHVVLLDLPSAAFDVDTPEDLRAARRRPHVSPQIANFFGCRRPYSLLITA